MELDIDQVKHLASLARIDLSREDLEELSKQLGNIFDQFESLRGLNLESVAPTAHIADSTNITREDQVGNSLTTDEVLVNAPMRNGDFFQVNPVLEE